MQKNVEVTPVERHLLQGLRFFPLTKGQRLRIFLMMDTEEQMLDMMRYMKNHQNATADELMAQAVEITGGLK